MNFDGYQQQITTSWRRGRRVGRYEGFSLGIVSSALIALIVWVIQ